MRKNQIIERNSLREHVQPLTGCEKKLLDLFLSTKYRRFNWNSTHRLMGCPLIDLILENKLAKDEREVLRCEN